MEEDEREGEGSLAPRVCTYCAPPEFRDLVPARDHFDAAAADAFSFCAPNAKAARRPGKTIYTQMQRALVSEIGARCLLCARRGTSGRFIGAAPARAGPARFIRRDNIVTFVRAALASQVFLCSDR